jgi:hypothetical protein
MGLYINPRGMTKEEWLEQNGLVIPTELASQGKLLPPKESGLVIVCLLDNRPTLPFTAAGVAYDYKELERFVRPDGRKRTWYWVLKEKIIEVTEGPYEEYEIVIPYELPDPA